MVFQAGIVSRRTQESRVIWILLIREFANTLVIEIGTDGSSRVREAE